MPLKTVLNSALVALNEAKTSAAITGNAATVRTLTTPVTESQPKSTISVKLAAALAIMGANCLLVIDPTNGIAVASNGANVKAAFASAIASGTDIATVVADSVSSDGLRARFTLAEDILEAVDNYAKPAPADADLLQLVDAVMPVRPMVSFDKALALFISYALKLGATSVVFYDQQTGKFSAAGEVDVMTTLPANPDATTVVFDYTEDADVVAGGAETPQFGG